MTRNEEQSHKLKGLGQAGLMQTHPEKSCPAMHAHNQLIA